MSVLFIEVLIALSESLSSAFSCGKAGCKLKELNINNLKLFSLVYRR